MRVFNNIETMIKETAYFFCVTILVAEPQAKKIRKALENYGFMFRIKIIVIPTNCPPKI